MRLSTTVATLLAIATFATACSDASTTTPAKPAPATDAAVSVPPEPALQGPITIIVKGKGTVAAIDGSFACTSDGTTTTGTCVPPHAGVAMYTAPVIEWGFDHWEPSMSADASMYINTWTPSPITAIFKKVSIPDASNGTAPPIPDAAGGD